MPIDPPKEFTHTLDGLVVDVGRHGGRASGDVLESSLDVSQIIGDQCHLSGNVWRIGDFREIAETQERRADVDCRDRLVELPTNLRVHFVEHLLDLPIQLIQLCSEELSAEMSPVHAIVDESEDARVQIRSTDDQITRLGSDDFI